MSSKLTFNDIENQELDPTKLNFTPDSLTNAVSSTSSDPSADAIVGAFAINTASGDIFRKTVAGSGAGNWTKISSITRTVLQNRYRGVSINSAVTSTDGTAPSIGDLVSYCGAGAWSVSLTISIAKTNATGAGSQNAAFIAGGFTNAITNATELFNGSAWSAGGVLGGAKQSMAEVGSQNAGLVTGGTDGGVPGVSVTELFNGSSWSTGGLLSVGRNAPAGAGSQNATFANGGYNGAVTNTTEIFNGSSWSASGNSNLSKNQCTSAGSQNAGLAAAGSTNGGTVGTLSVELFNGSSWIIGGALSSTRSLSTGAGSQNAAFIAGGATSFGPSVPTNITELFNGSSWSASGILSIAKCQSAGAGSQSAGLVAGGGTPSATNATELHNQTIFRKVYAKNLPESNVVGILSSASTVMLQGTNTSVTYPANKYLVANRSQNSAVTNYANLSAISIVSVLGTPPTMTYNFSTTFNLLSVIPGNIAIISGGSVTASNAGAFVISRVISPSSIEVQNANGVSENPITGNLAILNSMLAVDNISPQDIVIGKTDADGFLTVQRPLVTGSLLKRLK